MSGALRPLSKTEATALLDEALQAVQPVWDRIRQVERATHERVLAGFQRARVAQFMLSGTTGYGYDDPARESLEKVFAEAFQSEAAIVRPQIASGTHALWICLDALLKPGDHLLSVTGAPYDTLRSAIRGKSPQSLTSKGIQFTEIPLDPEGRIDIPAVETALTSRTRVVFLQRSKGYAWRPALGSEAVKPFAAWLKEKSPGCALLVDNCYGEFVEAEEPPAFGADLVAGSLIKNPGGTLAPGGGYIAGRRKLVEAVADRVTAPGLGLHVGPTLGTARSVLQGLYLAPHFVAEALAGLAAASYVFERLGYPVLPRWTERAADAVLGVALGSSKRLLAVCQGVQSASPVDSDVILEEAQLPGYDEPVVMAAGTFVQGASSEFSADGPMRPPFALFLQGGTSREYIFAALERILCTTALRPAAQESKDPKGNERSKAQERL